MTQTPEQSAVNTILGRLGHINFCKEKRITEKEKKTEKVAQSFIVRKNTRSGFIRPIRTIRPESEEFTAPDYWWLDAGQAFSAMMRDFCEWNRLQDAKNAKR